MEELEQVSSLVALGEEAQEVLRKACEEQGTNLEEVQSVVNILAVLCAYLMEQITDAFAALISSLDSILPIEDVFFMVPPHIRHLAYNHPKARVRNKNWNRMWKIRKRYMKWHKD